jgi:hypothetical protein
MMRIVLKKGKQRELIEEAKGDYTWKKLGNLLLCSEGYLKNDLKNERRLLDEKLYIKLNNLVSNDFNNFIIDKFVDNWGREKGGKNSLGNTKEFIEPDESENLAEFFGIVLGDGHVENIKIGKKIRCYSIVIAGDSTNDREYLVNYVSDLLKILFGERGTVYYSKSSNTMFLKLHGKKIVEFLENKGIKSGNKKINKQNIPLWILDNDKYLRACLRGLIDTDGCVYYISQKNRNLRITYTSYIGNLMKDVRESFIKLGFNPSKIIRNTDIYLSRKDNIKKYLNEIGFSNSKHLKRLKNLVKNAPFV